MADYTSLSNSLKALSASLSTLAPGTSLGTAGSALSSGLTSMSKSLGFTQAPTSPTPSGYTSSYTQGQSVVNKPVTPSATTTPVSSILGKDWATNPVFPQQSGGGVSGGVIIITYSKLSNFGIIEAKKGSGGAKGLGYYNQILNPTYDGTAGSDGNTGVIIYLKQ